MTLEDCLLPRLDSSNSPLSKCPKKVPQINAACVMTKTKRYDHISMAGWMREDSYLSAN